MPRTKADKTLKFPVTLDARKDIRIWTEACRKERAFRWRAEAPQELAAARGGNEVQNIRETRAKLEGMSGDFLWHVNTVPDAFAAKSPGFGTTSAMAELANGVGDAETAFLRAPAVRPPPRVAQTLQTPTILPWQHGVTDPCFLEPNALGKWQARNNANVLEMPPPPPRRTRVPAEVSGAHADAVAAWRRSEVPLSQWELSERGDSLVAANKLAETLGRDGAKEQLSKLLNFTEKVSRGKARWQER